MKNSINEYIDRGEPASSVLCASHPTSLASITSPTQEYLNELTGEQPSFEILDYVIKS